MQSEVEIRGMRYGQKYKQQIKLIRITRGQDVISQWSAQMKS